MAETCSLDVADRGGLTLEGIGALLNVTRERVRQIEERAPPKIRDANQDRGPRQTHSVDAEVPVSSDRHLLHVELVGIGRRLSEQLAAKPDLMQHLRPGEFEEFVCDRLVSLGLEPQRVGSVNHKDGGIDIIFWPRSPTSFPFLGAAQVKHHRDPDARVGSSSVRDFAGAIAGHPFSSGLLVTNTGFTPDAEWFAREKARLVRLRGFNDIIRWLRNDISSEEEWREIPEEIELCPGVVIKIR
jgi:hypothetical protein